ncbi:hypothetical protein T8K17_13230 [Thalassobaculum sp. OXR-137]|uniref:hypothetical protein n=1 Tax=Thalassobaculum sp. OXR-137 TaxID=3100173 RepID=UPI002AC9E44D|nr:hypothetical protein [Thalassobaculum sp. OXR-137]WPZ32204.1 hypothetical protein T8K17_13230 [Thalassobaculum sp. OXR-137]
MAAAEDTAPEEKAPKVTAPDAPAVLQHASGLWAPVLLALVLGALVFLARNPAGPPPRSSPPPVASVHPMPRAMALTGIGLPPPPIPAGAAASAPAPARPPAEPAASGSPESPSREAGTAAGAALLRALSSGTGPTLTLLWPPSPADRRRIADHLARCGGLVVALMAAGRLWRLEDPPGRPWTGRDGYSPLLRRADALAAAGSGRLAQRIRTHHGRRDGTPVALLARDFDARLLGGLARLAGPGATALSAAYAVDGDLLVLADIRIDGRPAGSSSGDRVALGRLGQCD